MDKVKLLHAIIETAIDGIITIDYRGIVESMNPAALKLFGYEEHEVKGK
ncbi:MAG: PAS domain-containing protein, partial [Sphingobacteriaceae bacterium]